MKITKSYLKTLIKEELQKVYEEEGQISQKAKGYVDQIVNKWNSLDSRKKQTAVLTLSNIRADLANKNKVAHNDWEDQDFEQALTLFDQNFSKILNPEQ